MRPLAQAVRRLSQKFGKRAAASGAGTGQEVTECLLLFPICMLRLIAGSPFGQTLQTDAFGEMEAKSRFEASRYSNFHGLHKGAFET
jgi:hypothetical protein